MELEMNENGKLLLLAFACTVVFIVFMLAFFPYELYEVDQQIPSVLASFIIILIILYVSNKIRLTLKKYTDEINS